MFSSLVNSTSKNSELAAFTYWFSLAKLTEKLSRAYPLIYLRQITTIRSIYLFEFYYSAKCPLSSFMFRDNSTMDMYLINSSPPMSKIAFKCLKAIIAILVSNVYV